MKVFSFTYDLNKPGQNYDNLIKEIKQTAWCHVTESNWLIATYESADQLYNRLSKHIDKNDHCLVIRVTSEYQGWLSEEKWKWIREQLQGQEARALYR